MIFNDLEMVYHACRLSGTLVPIFGPISGPISGPPTLALTAPPINCAPPDPVLISAPSQRGWIPRISVPVVNFW